MAYNKSYKEQQAIDYENLTGKKPPKILVDGIRPKSERNCPGLRTYEEPTEVKVYKVNVQGEKELIRIEQPQPIVYKPNFNNRKR